MTSKENHLHHHQQADCEKVEQDDEEITRNEALRSLLNNDELSDLTLRGSDGVLVLANRCLLASRSPVFYRMLYGHFQEASKIIIDLDYNGKVLQSIVNYIYTNDWETSTIERTTTTWDMNDVQFMMELIGAANYFDLSTLHRKVEMAADAKMKRHHDVATLFLAACSAPHCVMTQFLRESALKIVKEHPKILVHSKKDVLSLIHPSYIETILKEDRLPMDERSCFQLLESWATAEVSIDNDDDDGSEPPNAAIESTAISSHWHKSRKRIAVQMIDNIHLENIDTEELSTTVSASGLVTQERLCEAYKTQALRARKKLRTTLYKQWRGGPVWNLTKSTIFKYDNTTNGYRGTQTAILECPILQWGRVHKWSIKVLRYEVQMDLGVASTHWPINSNEALGCQRGGWAFSDETGWHALDYEGIGYTTASDLPETYEGAIISFTLNLEGEGILTASIDGGNPFEIFSRMMDDEDNDNFRMFGFVPAVGSYCCGRIEFLGFEEAS